MKLEPSVECVVVHGAHSCLACRRLKIRCSRRPEGWTRFRRIMTEDEELTWKIFGRLPSLSPPPRWSKAVARTTRSVEATRSRSKSRATSKSGARSKSRARSQPKGTSEKDGKALAHRGEDEDEVDQLMDDSDDESARKPRPAKRRRGNDLNPEVVKSKHLTMMLVRLTARRRGLLADIQSTPVPTLPTRFSGRCSPGRMIWKQEWTRWIRPWLQEQPCSRKCSVRWSRCLCR
jgi:hypothetical protein